MKALSIKARDSLDAKRTAAARQRKTNKSALVRKALEGALRGPGKKKAGSALEANRDLVGCVSGPADLSFNKVHLKTFGR